MFNLPKIKDRSLLLFTGVCLAFLAWSFFHYIGDTAFIWLLLAMYCIETFENGRLRKRLHEYKRTQPKQEPSAEVLAFVHAGNRASAIKAYRKQTGAELKEAIDAIDSTSSATQLPARG
jgi:hypothetical protein